MTTMLEVAKRAGVSKATVSRVLSGNGYVSRDERPRVSGHRRKRVSPQSAGAKPGDQTHPDPGLVVTNTLYHGVYFSELLFNAARMTEEKGRQLILADGKHSAEEEREAIQYLLDMRCDAVIIYPRFLSVEALDEIIEKCEQPIMVLNRRLRKNSSHSVWSDHKASCQDAVSQLIAKGHREIAFITGSLDSPTGVERLSGYRDALAQHGIAVRDALIAEGKWSPASGAAAVSQLLTRGEAFTALVASNDDMAIGAIRQLHESGVATPGAVSVIGFDDVAIAPYIVPSLSSVRIPVTEMIQRPSAA